MASPRRERQIQNRRRDEEVGGGLHGCTVAEDADADDVDGDSG